MIDTRHFSENRVIDSVYQNYTIMNTHAQWCDTCSVQTCT